MWSDSLHKADFGELLRHIVKGKFQTLRVSVLLFPLCQGLGDFSRMLNE
jgi:hypothetical protein